MTLLNIRSRLFEPNDTQIFIEQRFKFLCWTYYRLYAKFTFLDNKDMMQMMMFMHLGEQVEIGKLLLDDVRFKKMELAAYAWQEVKGKTTIIAEFVHHSWTRGGSR